MHISHYWKFGGSAKLQRSVISSSCRRPIIRSTREPACLILKLPHQCEHVWLDVFIKQVRFGCSPPCLVSQAAVRLNVAVVGAPGNDLDTRNNPAR